MHDSAATDPVLDVTIYSDPGCPWGYSEEPAITTLRWRYGAQLRWRLVLIGLAEDHEVYVRRGYTPEKMAAGYVGFRRFGQPFATAPKARPVGTSQMCRTVVATRLDVPAREYEVYRALQFAQFTTTLLLDQPADIRTALASVPDLDVDAIVDRIEDEDVWAAYESDRAETRTAAGSATEAQGKAANTDGAVRYTAASLVFTDVDGRRLEGGGFQPVEAYDVCIANLAPGLDRRDPPSSVQELLEAFPTGLTTQEVAATMRHGNDSIDRDAAELQLIELAAAGGAERLALGDDAVWRVSP